jgi:DNA helicase-2/ATP-dependent DNA helicase PcrA
VAFIQKLMREQPNLLLSELYHLILDETGYVKELRAEGTEEAFDRIENLEEFDTLLQEFEEDFFSQVPETERDARKKELLEVFLEQSSLSSDAGTGKDVAPSAVKLMSLHACKGLEFPVVFLVGMEEGLFPSIRAWEEAPDEDIEEERRLCYVGMTRARQRLYLSSVVVRRLWGQVAYQEPARFFAEIPGDHIQERDFSHGLAASRFRTGSSRSFGQGSGSASSPGYGSSSSASYSSSSSGSTYGSAAGWNKSAVPPKRPAYDEFDQRGGDDDADSWGQTGREGADGLIGLRVGHPEYGDGKIVSAEGSGDNTKVVVDFGGRDKRKFLFRFIRQHVRG